MTTIEVIEEFLKNPVVWIIWILLAITNTQLTELLLKLGTLLSSPLQAVMEGTDELRSLTANVTSTGREYIEKMKKLIGDGLDELIKEISSWIDPIRDSVNKLIVAVAPEDKRIWRIFGALLQLALFALFIFADAIQGANNLSTLFPDLIIPEPLRDITFSLLIASVGVVVALGVVLADIFGLTYFAPVEKIQGVWKIIYISIVFLTLIFTIALSTILALSRVPSLVVTLDPAAKETLINNASFAQSLVILPLLVTTVFLYWGAVGSLVLLCGFLLLATFGIRMLSFFLGFLKGAIEFGLISTDYLYNLFFGFVNLAIRMLFGLLFLLNAVISGLILVVQALLGVVLGPPILISRGFMTVVNFFVSRFAQ